MTNAICCGAAAIVLSMLSPAVADEPTVDDILDATQEAMGGRKAIDAVKTLHATMTMSAMGMQMNADWKWSHGGGRLITYITPMGDRKQGSDGTVSWNYDPQTGYTLANDDELKLINNQAGFHMALADLKSTLFEDVDQLEYVGVERFASQECHKIYHLDTDGEEGYLFVNVGTSLPVGFQSIPEQEGAKPDEMIVSNWKKVEGVQFFHTLEMRPSSPGMPVATMNVVSLNLNTLDDAVFELPEEVRDLAAAADSPEIKPSELTDVHRARARVMIDEALQAPGTTVIDQVITAAEGAVGFLQGDERKMYEYVIQELKKEREARGG